MNLISVPHISLKESSKEVQLAPEKILTKIKPGHLNEVGKKLFFNLQKINLFLDTETHLSIVSQSKVFFKNSSFNLFLGGDHSITYPLFQAFSQTITNPGIIIFDAHPDCQSGVSINGKEDLLMALLKYQLVKRENILLVGLRSWTAEEYDFLKKNNIRYYSMWELSLEGVFEISEAVMSIAKEFGGLYVSIDIDVLDPAFAPGAGCLEPGGLTSRELLFFLQRLKRLKNFKGADLTEIKANDEQTVNLGAKIVTELLSEVN